jgi:hypothetical protein
MHLSESERLSIIVKVTDFTDMLLSQMKLLILAIVVANYSAADSLSVYLLHKRSCEFTLYYIVLYNND